MTTMSITEANRSGLSGLVSAAEKGEEVSLSRHGRVVAEVISSEEARALRADRETLRDAALVMTRLATDSGNRTDLDDVMASFGIDRADLEREIADGLHTVQ